MSGGAVADDDRFLLLISEAMWGPTRADVADDTAQDVLDARVHWLCQDCAGQGVIALPEWEGHVEDCQHWEAPTVGDLLRAAEKARRD